MLSGIEKAIEAAGGPAALARKLGVTHQFVYQCRKRGWVPPVRAVEIEALYGIPRRELVSLRLLHLVDVPTDADLV